MAKQSGIGANLYVNGVDLSGDVGAINAIRDSQNLLDVTGLDKAANERITGLGDGEISFTSFFNDAVGGSHLLLRARGSGDKLATLAVGTTLGKAGWSLTGKQTDYGGTRGADGSLAFSVGLQTSDGNGLRAGEMLTAGIRTDTTDTEGTGVDGGAATTFGAVLYLHVFALTGADVTVAVEDSANNIAWAALSGGAFTQVTAAPGYERLVLANNATVRRYLRAVTTGDFTSVSFAVMACRRFAAD